MTSSLPPCPTPCDPDCEAECHEVHNVTYKRGHQPHGCLEVREAIATTVERLPAVQPAQVFTSDYGAEECAALYAIESDTGSCGWVLETRHDEHGAGTPLIWLDHDDAMQVIKDAAEESGCYGGQRIVAFAVHARGTPPVRCECCGEWGHLEEACPKGVAP